MGSGFAHFFGQIVSVTVKTIGKTNLVASRARFSKVPIINGPGKLLPFTLKIEVLRWLNTVLAVSEYRSFAKLWQEKGCSSQAETWQVKNIMMKDFD